MGLGWEGEKVRLVPLEKERHFENCVRWLNDPVVTQWLLVGDFPLTRVAEQEFFDRVSRESEKEVVFAIETRTEEEEHIGVCGTHNISFRDGTATVGIAIGRPKLWGKGYGTDAVALLTRHAREVLGLRLVLAEVFAENKPSLRVFEKNGYHEVGRIPARRWKRGAYRDEVIMACMAERRAGREEQQP